MRSINSFVPTIVVATVHFAGDIRDNIPRATVLSAIGGYWS